MTRVAIPPVVVRPALWRDLGAVVAIESASFSDPWSVAAFESSLALPHFRFLVATRSDGPARAGGETIDGYVLAMALGPEGEIADIAVSVGSRGRGIGGVLLDAGLGALVAAGVGSVFLEVRESNGAARRLYASRGFIEQGRRRGYYRQPPEDALVLRREIAPL